MYTLETDNEESATDRLTKAVAHSSSDTIERYLQAEIKIVVQSIRELNEHNDEEIFDMIMESHEGDMSEFEKNTLAGMLGIA